jgi:uncharacterized protein
MELPTFKYHPDPISTGSIIESQAQCVCCGQMRGFVYCGPVYAIVDYDTSICPWCIADGSAHERLHAEFSDSGGVGGHHGPRLPKAIVEEVAFRTPGFAGWQQEIWMACCNDAAAFLGPAGKRELLRKWPGAIPSIRQESGIDDSYWSEYYEALNIDGGPTAYVFQCLHCRKLLGYSDCH